LLGTSPEFWGGSQSLDTIRGHIAAGRGIGEDSILKFLANVPGINKYSVIHQLTNLRTSGAYARLIAEVEQEIAAEATAAQARAEAAQQERERLERERSAALA
jgi:hypothetical protein